MAAIPEPRLGTSLNAPDGQAVLKETEGNP